MLTPIDEQPVGASQQGPFLQGAAARPGVAAPALAVGAAPAPRRLNRLGLATGAGSVALFSTALATHFMGVSSANSLNAPGLTGAAKTETAGRVNTLSTASMLSAGGGMALGLVAAVLFIRD